MANTRSTRNYWLFVSSYAAILLVGFVLGVALTYVAADNTKASPDIVVQTHIDYGDGNVQALPTDLIAPGTSMGAYLELLERRYGVQFDVRTIGNSIYVEAIQTVYSSQDAPWKVAVDSTEPQRFIQDMRLNEDATLIWKK
jgi:hypothetical protein